MRLGKAALAVTACLALAGSAWGFEASWTDQFGETTYTIAGPDTAIVNVAFQVTISVADPFYPEDGVAAPWNIQLDAAVHDNGFFLFLTGGFWSETYTFSFSEEGSHDFLFSAQDLGHGGGAHNWEWAELAGSTLLLIEDVAVESVTWSRVKSQY